MTSGDGPEQATPQSIKPAVRPVCEECGAAGGYIKRRPHSTAEIGRPNNPMLCLACAREVQFEFVERAPCHQAVDVRLRDGLRVFVATAVVPVFFADYRAAVLVDDAGENQFSVGPVASWGLGRPFDVG